MTTGVTLHCEPLVPLRSWPVDGKLMRLRAWLGLLPPCEAEVAEREEVDRRLERVEAVVAALDAERRLAEQRCPQHRRPASA